jgi:hypothetical protein
VVLGRERGARGVSNRLVYIVPPPSSQMWHTSCQNYRIIHKISEFFSKYILLNLDKHQGPNWKNNQDTG